MFEETVGLCPPMSEADYVNIIRYFEAIGFPDNPQPFRGGART